MPDETGAVPLPSGGQTALQVRQPADLAALALAPVPAAEGDDSIHIRDLVNIVLKRKWAVISVLVIVVVATLVTTSMITPTYRATITLQIERDAPKVVDYKDVTPVENAYDDNFYRTQYELLKSRTLAERVVEQLNLRQTRGAPSVADSPWWARWLGAHDTSENAAPAQSGRAGGLNDLAVGSFLLALTVEPIRASKLVRVSFDSPDQKLAADALNALAQNFINVNLERRFDASSYAKTFLEEKIAQTKAKLEEAERALVQFQREQHIVNVDEKQNVLAQTLSEFNNAVSRVEQERLKAESLYREFNANPESAPQVVESKSIQDLKAALTKMQAEYQDLARIYKPAFPKMRQLQAAIEEVNKQLQTEIEIVRRSVEGNYKALLAQEASLNSRLQASKRDVLDLQGRSIQYNILKRDVDTNRLFYDGLLQRLKEVGVAGGIGINNITIVDPALAPTTAFKPNLRQNLVLALVLGLIGGIGLAFFLEYLDDTIRHPEDMERLTGLPVLGVIPLMRKQKSDDLSKLALTAHEDVRSTFAEAYRSVRTALQFSTHEGAPRQFIVTSTSSGEGKTTTALSLAINFAQTGRPVLIIDADLRRPSLHKLLDLENSRGVSNCLSSDIPALGAVRTTKVENLFVITAGPLPPNPVELLSGAKLMTMLAELGSRFSQIIIDAPPVLGLADTIVLGNQVGSVIFLVSAGHTRKASAKAALKRLRQGGVQPIGAVMTKLSARDSAYGYYQSYYYYQTTNEAPRLEKT